MRGSWALILGWAPLRWSPNRALKFEAGGANQNIPTVAPGGSQTADWQLKADKQAAQVTVLVQVRDASGALVAEDTTTMIIVK